MSSVAVSTTSFARSPRRLPRTRSRTPPELMTHTFAIFRRELRGYFATPLAYVFIVIFLVLAGVLTFFVGNFFDRGQADLQPFFTFHPRLYLLLIPALSMRLWAEERRSGTIELFLTLPIRLSEAIVGKFLAAWCFAGLALALLSLPPPAAPPPGVGVWGGGAPDGVLAAGAGASLFGHFSAIARGVVHL